MKKISYKILILLLNFTFFTAAMIGCNPDAHSQDSQNNYGTVANHHESETTISSPAPDKKAGEQSKQGEESKMPSEESEIPNHSNYIELFVDPDFEKGLLLSPLKDSEQTNQSDIIDFGSRKGNPGWKLVQWFSNFSLKGVAPVKKENSIEYVNEGKRIALKKEDGKKPELTLEMFGSKEYEKGPRRNGDAWPHLLIEQAIGDKPLITEMDRLVLSFQGEVEKCENLMGKDFNPNLHSAHVNFYFIVQNQNGSSTGYGDFFWFGIPFYDFRYEFFPEYLAADGGKEGASKKMIYTVGGSELYMEKHEPGKRYSAEIDLLPHIRRGLEKGHLRKFLSGTKLEDLKITAFNVGWELFGTFDVSFIISELSLKAYYKDNRAMTDNVTYTDTFESGNEWTFLSGDWSVKGGVLSNTDGKSWLNRAALKGRKYSDFTMDLKLRHDEESEKDRWAGVAFRKNSVNDTHEESGFMLFVRKDGTAQIYRRGQGESPAVKLPGFKAGEFYPIRLVAKGDTFQVFGTALEKPVLEYKDSSYEKGFVALVAGMAKASFDDVSITVE